MGISALNFKQIRSIEELQEICLNDALQEGEWKILVLDLDQTLIQGRPILGNEHFYRFMQAQNRLQGLKPDAHYSWTVQVREQIAYETCEQIDKVNQVITRFFSQGWTVKILTSRGLEMMKCTQFHLEKASLVLRIDDVIFKECDIHGKLMPKDESLIEWMKKQPQWERATSIRIRFADDSEKYCAEVHRIPDQVNRASVECFHYTGALPDPDLTREQLEQLVVQLHAYHQGIKIPYCHNDFDVTSAMVALGITEINAVQVHRAIGTLAALPGF